MNDKKQINISVNDNIQINTHLAIILANEMWGWLYERFVNLIMYGTVVDYIDNINYSSLVIKNRSYSYEEVLDEGIYSIIEDNIRDDCVAYFSYVWVDEYEIQQSIWYKSRHFVHQLMIYGYNKTTRIFNAIFFDVRKGQIPIEVKYEDLYVAIKSVKDHYQDGGDITALDYTIVNYGYLKQHESCFHLDVFINQLNNYLASYNDAYNEWNYFCRNDIYYYKNELIYGIRIYQKLIEFLEHPQNGTVILPYKSIHDFIKHKGFLLERLKYIRNNYSVPCVYNILISKFEEHYLRLEKIRLMGIKKQVVNNLLPSRLCQDTNYIQQLVRELKTGQEREVEILQQIVECLSSITYPNSYIDRFNVYPVNACFHDKQSSYIEFKLENPCDVFRIDIQRNKKDDNRTMFEKVVLNDTVEFLLPYDDQNGTPIRTIEGFDTLSVKNIKIYTNADKDKYTVNLFLSNGCFDGKFDLKMNEKTCKLKDVRNVKYNLGVTFDVDNIDPNIVWKCSNLLAQDYKHMHIRMKVIGDSVDGKLFFMTESHPYFSNDYSYEFKLDNCGEYRSYIINLEANDNWKGEIRQIRFDPVNYKKGFELDYNIPRNCHIEKVELLKNLEKEDIN